MSTIFKITAVFLLLTSIPLTTSAQAAKVNWMSLEEAVAAQQDEPRKIIMDVYTQWCGPCKMMMSRTFTNQQVIDYINGNYYAVKFDAESANPVEIQRKNIFKSRMETKCARSQQHA
jgi:thiol:disulfide interchange protein